MRLSPRLGLGLLLTASTAHAQVVPTEEDPAETTATASATTTLPPPACTALSTSGSGAYFDLRPDRAHPADDGKTHSSGLVKDYYARGWDYGRNFTMNICGAVVEPVIDVEGVNDALWANVSAYYTDNGRVYSIGSESLDLQSRGRKLVLQYTGGSPCGPKAKEAEKLLQRREAAPLSDDFDDALALEDKPDEDIRRKSTTISFLCDHEPSTVQAAFSFVGTDPDECAYFFEARSVHACAVAEPHKPGSVGPASIFGVILIIAGLVYVLGGVFYNRTVAHARGWRQLPNYSLWAGIWDTICMLFFAALNSCARLVPGRRSPGYSYRHLTSDSAARNRDAEAENRLIDQLDEDWDD